MNLFGDPNTTTKRVLEDKATIEIVAFVNYFHMYNGV